MSNWDYLSISAEFAVTVPEWDKLEGFAQDAIIRDALHRAAEYRSYWANQADNPIQAFVANYIEVVKNLPLCYPGGKSVVLIDMWRVWGTTLRLLEINY